MKKNQNLLNINDLEKSHPIMNTVIDKSQQNASKMVLDKDGEIEKIKFKKTKEYIKIRDLSHGACGQTILMLDEDLQKMFVCKKYRPIYEEMREELYVNFTKEIQLLHQIDNLNIVRVFNYYLYDKEKVGFIIMEYIDGQQIDDYLHSNPEKFDSVFLQVINGFCHLEERKILHRDVRFQNILVSNDGIAKIIDLGFSKIVLSEHDFNKSISLNWPFTTPKDFEEKVYDFCTEVYFAGCLFREILEKGKSFKSIHSNLINSMTALDRKSRPKSFHEVNEKIAPKVAIEVEFSEKEIQEYRSLSSRLNHLIYSVEENSRLHKFSSIIHKLKALFFGTNLEEFIPDNFMFCSCFIDGPYVTNNSAGLVSVEFLKKTIKFLGDLSPTKSEVFMNNLETRFSAFQKFSATDDEIPF